VLRLTPSQLTDLMPRLERYLGDRAATWPNIVEAADYLRGELGVSKTLWGEACRLMGRETAAIAVAIVASKPLEHFTTTPGGYFYGMVTKARAGDLNLDRTLWALREAKWGKEGKRRLN